MRSSARILVRSSSAPRPASPVGPAYEYAMILSTDLRRRGIRDKVPMTYITSEPYVGHLGLGGVGRYERDARIGVPRSRHQWIVNAKTTAIEPGLLKCAELDDQGQVKKEHEVPFKFAMVMPAFKGVDALMGVEGLVNPRGFVIIDKNQRNPKYRNVFGVGVCVAIPPVEATPVPTGTPKTGYMIELMVTATAHNIAALIAGREAKEEGTWNAVCLADFGDKGVAFVAQSRRFRRATSTGRARGGGCISPRSPMRNTSCARSARDRASLSMSATS